VIAQLRKLVLGETWTLPIGVLITLAAGLALDAIEPRWWDRAGGFVLLAGAVVTLTVALRRGSR
jgi:drug/metabolite transporter superfamily protein YnfA